MNTILIALALYAAFVIIVFVARFILWVVDGFKAENAKIRAKQAEAKTNTDTEQLTIIVEKAPVVIPQSIKAIEALHEQRRIIEEMIADIDEQLDYCPPTRVRNQYLNRKTVLLGKLATVEKRITRMCA